MQSEQLSESYEQAHVLGMRPETSAGERSRQEIHAGHEAQEESRALPAMFSGSHAIGEKQEPGKLKKRKRGQQINRVRINF